MTDRTFTPEQLEEIGVPFETDGDGCAEELARDTADSGRWNKTIRLVFRAPDDGNTYLVRYQVGLTEQQDCDLWFGDEQITATEVEQRPIVVQQWKPVGAPAAPDNGTSDSLPAWLYQRFNDALDAPAWGLLADADRTYWEHHAAAVRRAVARGGFKAAEEQPAAEGAQR